MATYVFCRLNDFNVKPLGEFVLKMTKTPNSQENMLKITVYLKSIHTKI